MRNGKFTIVAESFSPHRSGTLRGYVTIKITELHLIVSDIAIHARDGRNWISLPCKAFVKDLRVQTRDDGSPIYSPILQFDDRRVHAAFQAAVLRALDESPYALNCKKGAAP